MIDWSSVVSLLLVGLAVMGSPGPSTISVTAVASAFGVARSIPYTIGLILGTTAVLFVVATGLTAVVLSVPFLAPVLVGVSIAYVFYLAYRIATAPPLAAVDPAAAPPALWGGVVLGIANPKAYIAIAAVFAAIRVAQDPATDAAWKTVILTLLVVLIHVAWLLVGVAFAALLHDPARSRVANLVLAVALVVFTLWGLVPGAFSSWAE